MTIRQIKKTIQECCRVVDSEESVTDQFKEELKKNCNGCFGGCGMNPR